LDGKFQNCDFRGIINYVHSECPEWEDPHGSFKPISTRAMLKSLGKSDKEIEWIIEDQKAFADEDEIFRSLTGP
jgi:hypothetical protein